MTDEQLSALLRLKRHETPPPGYFDRLLVDVQRRQRAELLRRPLWKIAVERFQTFFGEHSMGPFSYAGAVASAVAVVALGAGVFTVAHERMSGSGAMAENAAPGAQKQRVKIEVAPPRVSPAFPGVERYAAEVRLQPRYVIDARPVSYERPSSF